MAITKARKEELVAQYIRDLEDSEAIIVAEYSQMTVKELETLRGKLREVEGSFAVVKTSLAKIALEQVGQPTLDDLLTGPVGITFCHHNIPGVTKAINAYAKENEKFLVKGALLGQQIIEAEKVKDLADMPTIEETRARLLGLINAPATQLASILNRPASGLVTVLSAGTSQLVNVINAYAHKAPAEDAEAA